MTSKPSPSGLLHFSTDGLEKPDRFTAWRDLMDTLYPAGIRIRQPAQAPFFALMYARQLLETRIAWGYYGATLNHMEKEESDDLLLVINLKGTIIAAQRGKDARLDPGDSYLMTRDEAFTIDRPDDGALVSIRMRRDDMAPFLGRANGSPRLKIPRGTEGLSLLGRYVWMLDQSEPLDSPQSLALVTTHVHDLVALVLGADREARERARRGGLRATQFKAIKAHIEQHLSFGKLTPETLAPLFGMSARTIQRLFERDGTTFSEFVRDQRLLFAKRLLSSPRARHKTIAEIALDSGFADVSNFNREFRRRFDHTPGEIRNARQI
jgi:AraC-like DNA-binding protein